MATRIDSGDEERTVGDRDRPQVTAHESAPGRLVFTEAGNTDGWIATDVAVDVGDRR